MTDCLTGASRRTTVGRGNRRGTDGRTTPSKTFPTVSLPRPRPELLRSRVAGQQQPPLFSLNHCPCVLTVDPLLPACLLLPHLPVLLVDGVAPLARNSELRIQLSLPSDLLRNSPEYQTRYMIMLRDGNGRDMDPPNRVKSIGIRCKLHGDSRRVPFIYLHSHLVLSEMIPIPTYIVGIDISNPFVNSVCNCMRYLNSGACACPS